MNLTIHRTRRFGAGYGAVVMGNQEPVLVVVRGPSGAGKSSIAARLRARYGRGLAVVSQDVLRRIVLRERDIPGAANISLIDLVARHALGHGYHVVVEGILDAGRYGPMLARLVADHRSASHLYYLDVPFEETVRRHATRPESREFSPEDMAGWYRPRDVLPGGIEHVVSRECSLEETAERILADTGLTPPGWVPLR